MEHDRFASIVTPHAAAMARVAAALVGIADAEDAAQEALLRAWRHWPSLRDDGAAHTWLLRITINVCHNWQSGHFGTTRRRNESLDRMAQDNVSTYSRDILDDAEALDLRQAVMKLPIDLRRVVALRFYAGMDSTQIGAVLDMPATTVRTRLRRALEILRETLDDGDSTAATQPPHTTSRREEIPNG